MLSRCFLDFSVGVGAFVIGLSQISSFFSQFKWHCNVTSTVTLILNIVFQDFLPAEGISFSKNICYCS